MSRNQQQLAQVGLKVFHLARRKLGIGGAIAAAIAVLLYAFVLQPYVEKSFGIALPNVVESSPAATRSDSQRSDSGRGSPHDSTSSRDNSNRDAPNADAGELSDVLTDLGRGTYRSNAGLRYTRGSQHGTRLAHLMAHARDQPDRVGQHGVFDETDPASLVRLIDEVYQQALSGTATRRETQAERTTYTVDRGSRIGYVGGQSGKRKGHPAAEHIRLVLEGDRFITAYPVLP